MTDEQASKDARFVVKVKRGRVSLYSDVGDVMRFELADIPAVITDLAIAYRENTGKYPLASDGQ